MPKRSVEVLLWLIFDFGTFAQGGAQCPGEGPCGLPHRIAWPAPPVLQGPSSFFEHWKSQSKGVVWGHQEVGPEPGGLAARGSVEAQVVPGQGSWVPPPPAGPASVAAVLAAAVPADPLRP